MTKDDLPQVVAIERASFPHPWPRKSFEHELDVPFATCLVAHPRRRPADVIGYVIWWRVADEIHLLNVATASKVRRRGVGRWLAETVLADARSSGARIVLLEVSVHNTAARALYESLGFVIVRQRRDYYAPRDHALVAEWIVK